MTASVWMKSSRAKAGFPVNSGSANRLRLISCRDRPQRRHDPRRDGVVEVGGTAPCEPGIPDREDPFADPHVRGRPEGCGGQAGAVDPDDGDVGGRIAPHDLRAERASVLQRDRDALRVVDDVIVGHHVAVFRDDEPAAADRDHVRHAALRLLSEEPVESVLISGLPACRLDHHHRGRDRVGDVDERLAQVEGGLNGLIRDPRIRLDDDRRRGRLDKAELGSETQSDKEAARDREGGFGLCS